MKNTVCIYHANCADGFAGAWVAKKAYDASNAKIMFHPGVYGTPPPDEVHGAHVVLVDFSYKRPVMDELASVAKTVTVIDHHKTAIEELEGINTMRKNVRTFLDVNHSGSMLAWKYYFGEKEPPALLYTIEDRDLWRFALNHTREIQANVFSYPYDFDVWEQLMSAPLQSHIKDGAAIERKHFKDCRELVEVTRRWLTIGGHRVEACSLPYTMSSDVGHYLALANPFGVCYWDTPTGRVFSLRSVEGKVDVSEVARSYGGGGHKHAAGFTVPYDVAATFET